jgi:DNA-binding MarR family transcriptional regulator
LLNSIALPFAPYQSLPLPEHRWLLACLRYADRNGRCWPSMRTLARDAVAALSTVQRHLSALEKLGCFTRKRRPGGGYVYRIDARFLPTWATKTRSCPAGWCRSCG